MDIRCPKCGEPWDNDTLHDEVAVRNPNLPWLNDEGNYEQSLYEPYYNKIRQEFRMKGCEALKSYGGHHNEPTLGPKNSIFGAIMDFAGDDIDFAAGMMEDAESWGLLD